MKKRVIYILYICIMFLFAGCGTSGENQNTQNTDVLNEDVSNKDVSSEDVLNAESNTEVLNTEEIFSKRDYAVEYDEAECAYITLNGDSAACNSNAVDISDGIITILDEGTYVIAGTLKNGMIIVESEDTDKTQIVLDGAAIHSETSAAIYVKQSDKVFLTLADDSKNVLSNGGSFENIDENNIDGVIFSKADLTLNGTGELTITSPGGHGIVSKDDLKIMDGVYEITAASHGLSANDLIAIASGELRITSGEDGINSEVDVYMEGGTYQIASGDDAIHADETLYITDGEIEITESYEGLEGLDIVISGGNISLIASDDGLNAAGGTDQSGYGGSGNDQFRGGPGGRGENLDGNRGGNPYGGRGENSDGNHGANPGGWNSSSNGSIRIEGGALYIKASGDGIDANGTLEIKGGNIVVCGPTHGDTATLDYDTSAVISGGTFIGTGAMNMAQTFSDAEQGVIAVSVGNQQAGTLITLTDSNGNTVISHTPELSFAVVILSSADIIKGETYTISVGSVSGEFQAE